MDSAAPITTDWGDSLLANLSTKYVRQKRLRCRVYKEKNPGTVEHIIKKWGQPWTTDDFGPVTVPKDSFFALGDNRYNALDSRFTGFVAQSSFKGTVLK